MKIEKIDYEDNKIMIISNEPSYDHEPWNNTYLKYEPNSEMIIDIDGFQKKINTEVIIIDLEKLPNDKKFIDSLVKYIINIPNPKSLFNSLKIASKFFDDISNVIKKEFLIGTFGELLFILKMYQYDFDIQNNFHEKLFDSNDFYFDSKTIEVKTNITDSNVYRVSNNQITPEKNNLFSMVCIKLNEISNGDNYSEPDGISLIELIEIMKNEMVITSPQLLELIDFLQIYSSKEKILTTIKFSRKCLLDETIKIYKKDDIPTIETNFSDRISNIKYDINFDGVNPISITELKKKLGNDDNYGK